MSSDDKMVRGRAEIAQALGRSEKTVSRWVERGVLPSRKAGPFPNSPLVVRASEIDRLKALYGVGMTSDD
jgi:hypothetical protein